MRKLEEGALKMTGMAPVWENRSQKGFVGSGLTSEDTCASLRNLCITLEKPWMGPPKRRQPLESAAEAAEAGLCMRKAFIFIFLLWALLGGDMLRALLILK